VRKIEEARRGEARRESEKHLSRKTNGECRDVGTSVEQAPSSSNTRKNKSVSLFLCFPSNRLGKKKRDARLNCWVLLRYDMLRCEREPETTTEGYNQGEFWRG
jgi:hypothetical protein